MAINRTTVLIALVTLTAFFQSLPLTFALTPSVDTGLSTEPWMLQYGTEALDRSESISLDEHENVFVVGTTLGQLGSASFGQEDVFLSKVDGSGNVIWTNQLGTSVRDYGLATATDSFGHVYVGGFTHGLLGESQFGSSDAFVSKFTTDGQLLWTHQFGTTSVDQVNAIAVDGSGDLYVAGYTNGYLTDPNPSLPSSSDIFLRKMSSEGEPLWTKQFAGDNSTAEGVAVDDRGNVFVTGLTFDNLTGNGFGYEIFLYNFSTDGSLQWFRQLGTPEGLEVPSGIAADGQGNAFITGRSEQPLPTTSGYGMDDAFLIKVDESGTPVWYRQLGTEEDDRSNAVVTDGLGNVYIAGETDGSIEGLSAGDVDSFLAKYDTHGNLVWKEQFGTEFFDRTAALATLGSGNVYLSGITLGDLFSTQNGNGDVFVVQYVDPVPEPSSTLLFAAFLAVVWWSQASIRR